MHGIFTIIYLHDWVILFGQMLGFIFQHHFVRRRWNISGDCGPKPTTGIATDMGRNHPAIGLRNMKKPGI